MKLKVIGAGFLFLLTLATANVKAQSQNSVEGDRQALVDLYNATNGDSWSNNSGWLSGNPTNSWHGIEVDANGRVTRVDLNSNNLSGTLPASIGNLTKATYFDVEHNFITGNLPSSMGNMTALKELWLAGGNFKPSYTSGGYHPGKDAVVTNSFNGQFPQWIGNLTNLVTFRLERQGDMTGEIPASIGNLIALKGLMIYGKYNDYASGWTGTIPPELGNCTNLVVLSMGRNALEGAVPQSVADLPELKMIDVLATNITSIPTRWGGGKLKTLWIQQSKIDQPFPKEMFDGHLPNLASFSFQSSSSDGYGFTGNIDDVDFSNTPRLNQFNLSGNKLSGSLPASVATGINPEIFNLGWQEGEGFSGTLPNDFRSWEDNPSGNRYIRLIDNNLTGAIPRHLPRQKYVWLQDNEFSSADPQSFLDLVGNGRTQKVEVDGNRLTPKDLEPAIGNMTGISFTYSGQRAFDVAESLSPADGETVVIDKSHQAYTGNSYQWTKDGVALSDGGDISGATTHTLTITNFGAADEGDYKLKITHSSFSQTFVSEPVQIEIN